jgi:hypothetical protein
MATADEYAAWIVKNADKKGTPEFDTVAKAYRLAAGEVTTQKKAPEPKYDPSEGGGEFAIATPFGRIETGLKTPQWLDRGLAGMGKAFADTAEGVAQLADRPLDVLSPRKPTLTSLVTGAPQSRVDQRRQAIEETRRRDAPLMDTTAGTVGNLLGNTAIVAAVPGGSTLGGAAGIGAGLGFLQPSTGDGETLMNTALGAAGGAGGRQLANMIGRAAQRPGNLLTQGQRDAAAAGQALGMRLPPGKASGSAPLQKIEAALEANPITSGGFDALKEGNQRVLNRAAAKAIGENADEVSTAVLSRAEARMGRVFDSVADKTPVPLDPQTFGGRLRQLAQESEGLIGQNGRLDDNALIQRLDGFINTNGGATREQLRALSSKLGKAARSNMTSPNGDRELGAALLGAQEIVEDAIEGSLSKAQRAAYGEARGQYRNLMQLLSGKAVNEASGNVNARSLASVLQKDRQGYRMGRTQSDLNDATRFVQAFPDIVGNSGTATRSMGPTDYVMGLPGNLLTRAYLSAPVSAVMQGGVGATGAAARLANRPANLLSQPVNTGLALTLPELLQQ